MGCIAWWSLRDNKADTVVLDSVVSPHNGVLDVNTNTLFNGQSQSLNFGNAHYAAVADNAIFTFADAVGDKPFSIVATVYLEAGITNQMIVTKYDTGNAEWAFYFDSAEKLNLSCYTMPLANRINTISDSAIAGNHWYKVAGTYSGSGSENGLKIYVDNVLVGQTKSTTGGYVKMSDTAAIVQIGCNSIFGVATDFYRNKMKNVMLFNYELTIQEIIAINEEEQEDEEIVQGKLARRYGLSWVKRNIRRRL